MWSSWWSLLHSQNFVRNSSGPRRLFVRKSRQNSRLILGEGITVIGSDMYTNVRTYVYTYLKRKYVYKYQVSQSHSKSGKHKQTLNRRKVNTVHIHICYRHLSTYLRIYSLFWMFSIVQRTLIYFYLSLHLAYKYNCIYTYVNVYMILRDFTCILSTLDSIRCFFKNFLRDVFFPLPNGSWPWWKIEVVISVPRWWRITRDPWRIGTWATRLRQYHRKVMIKGELFSLLQRSGDLGSLRRGLFFWGNFVSLMCLWGFVDGAGVFFVDVYDVHWVFFGWALLGVLWKVLLLGLFWDVLGLLIFFFVMFTACILWRPTLRHFWATSFFKTELCGGEGKMVVLDAWYPNHLFPFLTSMSQSCNVTIPAPCRPNVCPVHWQNWAVPKQWSIFARRYSNGHQKWSGYIRSNNHSHLIFTPLEKDLKHLWYIVKATIVLVLAVFYINPFAEDVLVVCRSKLGLYCTCKIPKIAQEKNRNGVDLDISHVHCFLLGNVSASGRLPGQGECGTHEECPRWRTEGPVLVSNWNHGNLWRSTPSPLQCHPLLWK